MRGIIFATLLVGCLVAVPENVTPICSDVCKSPSGDHTMWEPCAEGETCYCHLEAGSAVVECANVELP